jgi:hypothetical protein
MKQELHLRVVDRLNPDRSMTPDDHADVRMLITKADLELAKSRIVAGSSTQGQDEASPPTFVPRVDRVMLLYGDPPGEGNRRLDLRVLPHDQDTMAWLRGVLNSRDGRYCTLSYGELPKWKRCTIFVPLKLAPGGMDRWWADLKTLVHGHYKADPAKISRLFTQTWNDKKGDPSGTMITFAADKENLLKFTAAGSVPNTRKVYVGAGRYDIKIVGETIPPYSTWVPLSALQGADQEDDDDTEMAEGEEAAASHPDVN